MAVQNSNRRQSPFFQTARTFTCPDGKEATITMTVKHRSTDMKDFYAKIKRQRVTPSLSASWPKVGIWMTNSAMKTFPGFALTSRRSSWHCHKLTWPRLRATVQKFKAGCLSHASA
ncbi:hypothetical protein [Klebsiella phage vB_KshKPC-M]|nr:hypothetical protein [Klebsiella phage vB_KshKPC-M]